MTNPGSNPSNEDAKRLDLEIKRLSLQIKREELRHSKRPAIQWTLVIPLLTAIAAGLIAFLTNANIEKARGDHALQVEQFRTTTSLVLDSVKTDNSVLALNNLKFFLNAGLLHDPDGKIASLVENQVSPVLPFGQHQQMQCLADVKFISYEREPFKTTFLDIIHSFFAILGDVSHGQFAMSWAESIPDDLIFQELTLNRDSKMPRTMCSHLEDIFAIVNQSRKDTESKVFGLLSCDELIITAAEVRREQVNFMPGISVCGAE